MRDPGVRVEDMLGAIRNIYFNVNVVWGVVENDLPPLKIQLERILAELR